MIRFLSLFAVFLFIASPVMAQEDADKVLAEQAETVVKNEPKGEIKEIKTQDDESYEERLKLAQKMHEIWPMRQKVESALDALANNIKESERLKFKAGLRKAINYEALEETSIDAMADIYTIDELTKMIDFYGSKEGKSISYKNKDYEKALQPIMIKMMDKAFLDAKMGSQSFPK